MENPKRSAAALVLAGGGIRAEAARIAGVDKGTITKWMADEKFIALIESVRPELADQAIDGLHELIPSALSLLRGALEGDEVNAAKARIALDVIKAAAGIARSNESTGQTDLERRLVELDAQGATGSD